MVTGSSSAAGAAAETAGSLWSFLAALAAAAFVLNWFWEMLQMPAYAQMAGRSWGETALPCARASLGDVVLTLAIYGLGALAAGRRTWGLSGGWNVYAAGALLGGLVATALEHVFLSAGRWSYSERMPVVPGLLVGLWPLLQLVLLVPASLAVASWWARRARSGSPQGERH
ncbi:MAG: hypothetical protein U0797_07675 [Gemmataceae bacterium]|jgi:hypothetical protein